MLELHNLNAFYDDSHILQGIDLRVAPGSRVAVLGRNGAGKSTLMKGIMNAGPRVDGAVVWKNDDLGSMPAFRRARLGIAFVPEDRRIFSHLTVIENLKIATRATAETKKHEDPERLLEFFPLLQPLRGRFGDQLSGGQQQMLAVARGVASAPDLLLLDEPTEGLAPVIVEQLASAVINICNQSGTALLLSEQNVWFARRCTDYLYVLDSGRSVFEGSWSDFDKSPHIRTKYLAI